MSGGSWWKGGRQLVLQYWHVFGLRPAIGASEDLSLYEHRTSHIKLRAMDIIAITILGVTHTVQNDDHEL